MSGFGLAQLELGVELKCIAELSSALALATMRTVHKGKVFVRHHLVRVQQQTSVKRTLQEFLCPFVIAVFIGTDSGRKVLFCLAWREFVETSVSHNRRRACRHQQCAAKSQNDCADCIQFFAQLNWCLIFKDWSAVTFTLTW